MISLEAPALSPEQAAVVQQTLDDLNAQFDVVQTDIRIGPRVVTLHHPRDADDLIDEAAFAIDERLPYWADVWPSARVLAERLLTTRVDERRLLEVGCGSGLVSVAAAIAGFDVTSTDYYDEALGSRR
jgi:predicted nicotinamide N-methyase